MATTYLAFDLGASSGRAILGTLSQGRMTMTEVHRFETHLIEDGEHLYWDIERLWSELQVGLEKALDLSPALRSLSVDSWAVDYVPLDKDGVALRNAFCYRDPRTNDDVEKVRERVPAADIYRTTGIQHLPFNTIYQIFDDHQNRPEEIRETSSRLLIADYFNYRFSGRPVVEISNASTTQLVDPTTKQWAFSMFDALGFDRTKYPQIVESGTAYTGTPDSSGVSIVCGLSHDTACAVTAVPADDAQPWMYLSSGTWSLLGAELTRPILTDDAFKESYTNELGLDGTVRFLKNMTGMWALEECIRGWREDGQSFSYEDLIQEAAAVHWQGGTIDLDGPGFGDRGDMEAKILAECDTAAIPRPVNRAETVRLILESLASNYREKVAILKSLTGIGSNATLHIVGGGSRNHLLNQLTADACNMRIVAGPAESSALGNLLVQARTMGDLPEGMTIRDIARNSSTLTEFTPSKTTNR